MVNVDLISNSATTNNGTLTIQLTSNAPSSVDIANFQSHLNGNTSLASTEGLPPSVDFNLVQDLSKSVGLVSDQLKGRINEISKIADNHSLTNNTADLLRMQLELTQLSLETQLIGDMVTKSTKNIDQLTHLQ